MYWPFGTLGLDGALAWHYATYVVHEAKGLAKVGATLARSSALRRAVATLPVGEADQDALGDSRDFFLRSSPVRVCVMGTNEWIDLPSWPPPSTPTPWHLGPDGILSAEVPAATAAPSGYRYDPSDPTPHVGGAVVLNGGSTCDSATCRRKAGRSTSATASKMRIADQKVFHDRDHPSALTLPLTS